MQDMPRPPEQSGGNYSFPPGQPAPYGPTDQPGYPSPPQGWYPQQQGYAPQETNSAAVASLVCGIAGWFLVPLLGGIGAVITGHVALGQIRQSGDRVKGRGMAIAGLVMGYTNIVVCTVALIAVLAFFVIVGNKVV